MTPTSAFDFFATEGLPTPAVTADQAGAAAWELFGVDGRVAVLGSQQDANFLLEAADGSRYVLKVSNPAVSRTELLAQDAAAAHVAAADPELLLPCARPGAPSLSAPGDRIWPPSGSLRRPSSRTQVVPLGPENSFTARPRCQLA